MLACAGRERLLLWLEGQIEIVEPLERVGRTDRRPQFVGQLVLALQRAEDRLSPLVELPKCCRALLYPFDLLLVEAASLIAAVTGDERQGVSRVEQLDRPRDASDVHAKFLRNPLDVRPIHRQSSSRAVDSGASNGVWLDRGWLERGWVETGWVEKRPGRCGDLVLATLCWRPCVGDLVLAKGLRHASVGMDRLDAHPADPPRGRANISCLLVLR